MERREVENRIGNMQNKFKIEFNKDLTVKHQLTTCDGEEIKDIKVIEMASSYLNFNNDKIQFAFKVKNWRWLNIEVVEKIIIYEKMDPTTYMKSSRELPIICDESTEESNFTTVRVDGGFKDILLNLFSLHKKEFKLTINYKMDMMTYSSTYQVLIPDIDQKDWYPSVARTVLYKPEEVVGPELISLFKKGFKLADKSSQLEATLRNQLMEYADTPTDKKFVNFDFLDMFRTMLAISDLSKMKEMEDYNLTFQKVTHYQLCRYSLRGAVENHLKYLMCMRKMRSFLNRTYIIEATKKMPNDVMEFDHIYLTDMQDYQNYHDDLHEIAEHRICGKVNYIFGNLILFQLVYKHNREEQRKQAAQLEDDRHYHVEFLSNRIAIRVGHRAVEDAIKFNLSGYLKSFGGRRIQEKPEGEVSKIKWLNPSVANNKEQKAAIRNIINRTSFPSPYIVFGPPGTGKSTTIIEAVAQIVKLKPLAHILVTANSNSACDDIGNRLLNFVSMNKVLRIYSPAFDKKPEKIDKTLEPISNFRNRHLCSCKKRSCPEIEPCDDPTYEEFYTARVVIATLVSCGRIVSAGIKSNHFDYIFIDEAASETEQCTLIPISGLGATDKGITAQIVLSGDHKQLGPIVPERFLRKMGMEKSMMERIMETNVNYQLRPTIDQRYVTLLVKNYRSHPAILQFSNEQFYDSQLVPMCPKKIANIACGWDFLVNQDFPLLLHTTRTPSTEVGLSLMNNGEVGILDSYIRVLLLLGFKKHRVEQTDIGVISPYRAQRDHIYEQFHEEFPKIEIGTVDAFQGREKKIIIMSTVRSHTRHVGFLRNEKRLNVSLTRAQCLLIIVGNSATLQKCLIWNKFIGFCYNNRAVVGDAQSFDPEVVNDDKYQGNEERPAEIEDEYDGY